MKQVQCVKIKLKPGSRNRVFAWAQEIDSRKDEALATLRDEGIFVESFFLDTADDGDYLIGYIRAESFEKAAEAVRQSTHALDAYHQQFKRDTWESGKPLELLVDLERADEWQ